MEDFKLDIIIDQGPNARSVRLNLPRFTLIGATTRSGLLTAPLLTRFPMRERLDYYQADQLRKSSSDSAVCWPCEIESLAPWKLPGAAEALPELPTICSAGFAIMPKWSMMATLPARSPTKPWRCSRSTKMVWTKWTNAFWKR